MFLAEMSQADKERAQGRRIKFASKEGRQPHLTSIVAQRSRFPIDSN